MKTNRTFFLLCLLFIYSGCNKYSDFREVTELPASTLSYTQMHEFSNLILDYIQSDDLIFSDTRRYRNDSELPDSLSSDSCILFTSSTFIEDEENHRLLEFGFASKVSSDKLEDNRKFLKDPSDFENHLHLDIGLIDYPILCDVPEGKTFFSVALLQKYPNPEGGFYERIDTRTLSQDVEIVKFETEHIRHNDLGYILLEFEINYTAFELYWFFSPQPDNPFIPVNLKITHAIRFPEIDK